MKLVESRNIIWLTWEKQIRNRSMSRELGIPLFEILSESSRFIRYPLCVFRTISILYREKPSVVICQNPSIVLTLFLLFLKPVFGFKVGIDAHFGGIDAWTGGKVLQRVLNLCNSQADLVIVTNRSHAEYVCSLGGRAFVCPDPLPDLSEYLSQGIESSQKVFFICSFDVDEPFREVFRAAEILVSEGFRFCVSGNYQKAKINPDDFPQVELLGFVPEADFYKHLFSSQLVVDLTDNDNCLVCGAYEALAANKPLVLSRKKALEEFFFAGAVFTENQSTEISAAVRFAYSERLRLKNEACCWVSQAREDMRGRASKLKGVLEGI